MSTQKNSVIFFLLLLYSFTLLAQEKSIVQPPKVDKRIELISIVFRLADCHEYSSNTFPKYVEKIENHFSPYKNHELISFIKNEVRKQGVAFDAVMDMAINITKPPHMKLLIPSEYDIDSRWKKDHIVKFIRLLNDFYTTANCETFFRENEDLYSLAAQRFLPIYEKLDLGWYEKFYGTKPTIQFVIVNALGNGGGNYGPNIKLQNGESLLYAIMGTTGVDELGMPTYKNSYFPVLLHEFNHSFVNKLIFQYEEPLEKSGKFIFKHVEKMMRRQAYGSWRTMYCETLVRACVVKYLKDHNFGQDDIQKQLNYELAVGFLWTQELLEELERYDQNREKYPTLESFMPELVVFFDKLSSNFSAVQAKIDKKRPKVVELKPFENGSQLVDPNTKMLQVFFDREMKGMGFTTGEKGDDAFPEIKDVTYTEDKKSIVIEMELQANKEYQMVLWGAFKSTEGFPLKNFTIDFKTVEFTKNN